MFRKWKERDARKLRMLERKFDRLSDRFESLNRDYEILRSSYRQLEERVDEKEVTHIQKVKVEVTKPFDYSGWYP